METEYDLVSAVLRIGEGGINFFASCLLYLDPNELKMCRLVNRAWDEFIRKEVWGSKGKRLLLKEKSFLCTRRTFGGRKALTKCLLKSSLSMEVQSLNSAFLL